MSAKAPGRKPLPASLYAETAREQLETPPLRSDARTKVAIVGGGITGLSAALHLARTGIEATVIEAHEPGWGASGRNGGQVNPGLYPDPAALIARFGADRARRMMDHASAAPNRVFALVAEHGLACEAAQTGTLRVAFGSGGLARARSTFDQLRGTASPATWCDALDLQRATGTARYRGGIRFPQGGKLNPLGFTRGLAAAAMAAGARIHGSSPALRLTRESDLWRIETPQGCLRCDHLILATNGYTDDLWPRLRQTLVPVYTTIVATAPLPADTAREILPSGSVVYEVGRNTVYYRLDAGGRLLMGGRSVQRDVRSVADGRHLRDYAVRLWPALRSVGWRQVWNGQVAVTADHLIHVHEPARNVLVCLGYNGRGIAMATVLGAALAERVAGADIDDLPIPVSALRPMRFHRFWRPAVRARLALGRLQDASGL